MLSCALLSPVPHFGICFRAFIKICAAQTPGAAPSPAFSSMDNYTLAPVPYLTAIDAPTDTLNFYYLYPRQIRFYLDELYNDQARMPSGTLTLNNSVPISMSMLLPIFQSSMGTLAYVNGSGTYGYIAATDAAKAFNAAIASQQLTPNSVLNLNSPTDRATLFALLDTALGNLETNLGFKFTATTETDL